jgi:hypothetical protein
MGVNEGVNIPPRGQSSPLGAKIIPRGEVLPWGPGVKLRMALWLAEFSARLFTILWKSFCKHTHQYITKAIIFFTLFSQHVSTLNWVFCYFFSPDFTVCQKFCLKQHRQRTWNMDTVLSLWAGWTDLVNFRHLGVCLLLVGILLIAKSFVANHSKSMTLSLEIMQKFYLKNIRQIFFSDSFYEI